ncbi:MAG: DUF4167 domain-containing protein [Alphaproteobacteria bacterium]|jgi:hypothetical protein|nr:DUF4167 domain-containing protein [Alphaproteobacteria bacterium]
MRPQQQNRRMRGRNNSGGNNNNNRKGPNPLTRNYESNGPDVKIRGSAQQIAEKYAQLARDAHSSGDRVMAENYLQHAEHYNRIIAAAQAQLPIQNQNARDNSDDNDNDDDRDDFDNQGSGDNAGQGGQDRNQDRNQDRGNQERSGQGDGDGDQNRQASHGTGPQPVIDGTPAEVALNSDASGEGNGSSGRHAKGQNGSTPDGDAPAPRRGRRPRRGERARPEGDDEVAPDSGLAQTLSRGAPPEPVAEKAEKSDTPLIDADS